MGDIDILTVSDAALLAQVIALAMDSARVAWVDDIGGDVQHGTVRSIGDERGNHAGPNDDVRDCFLRITTSLGFEWFVPMRDACVMFHEGRLVRDREVTS